jgi:AcrR family transcriptional regulator
MLGVPTSLTRVPLNVDTVNMVGQAPGERPRDYHHGNLRVALVDAGVELARSGGPNAVVMRAVSRCAGVSHNAAYRHFANQEDLVAAVAERCMAELGQRMLQRSTLATARGPISLARARLDAIGRAYIDFARTEPGWFRTAFGTARHHSASAPITDLRDPVSEQPPNPFSILSSRLDELVQVGALSAHRRRGAEYAAWSAVHGLSCLILDGPLAEVSEPEVEAAIAVALAVVNRGLR